MKYEFRLYGCSVRFEHPFEAVSPEVVILDEWDLTTEEGTVVSDRGVRSLIAMVFAAHYHGDEVSIMDAEALYNSTWQHTEVRKLLRRAATRGKTARRKFQGNVCAA